MGELREKFRSCPLIHVTTVEAAYWLVCNLNQIFHIIIFELLMQKCILLGNDTTGKHFTILIIFKTWLVIHHHDMNVNMSLQFVIGLNRIGYIKGCPLFSPELLLICLVVLQLSETFD